jgi:hypothetical protein
VSRREAGERRDDAEAYERSCTQLSMTLKLREAHAKLLIGTLKRARVSEP